MTEDLLSCLTEEVHIFPREREREKRVYYFDSLALYTSAYPYTVLMETKDTCLVETNCNLKHVFGIITNYSDQRQRRQRFVKK